MMLLLGSIVGASEGNPASGRHWLFLTCSQDRQEWSVQFWCPVPSQPPSLCPNICKLEQLLLLQGQRSGFQYKWEGLLYKLLLQLGGSERLQMVEYWPVQGEGSEKGRGESRGDRSLGKETARGKGTGKKGFHSFHNFSKGSPCPSTVFPQSECMVCNPSRELEGPFKKKKKWSML